MFPLRLPQPAHLAQIYFLQDFRFYLKVAFHIHDAVNFLLNVCHLGVAVAAESTDLLNRRGNIIKALYVLFFCVYLAAVTPAFTGLVKGDASVLADYDGLALVNMAVGEGGFPKIVVKPVGQNFVELCAVASGEIFAFFDIVVERDYVGKRMFPAVIANHGPESVVGFC